MKPDFLLTVPEGTTYDGLPAAQQAELDSIQCDWPATQMPGTQPAAGYKLVHVIANTTLANAEALVAFYALDWTFIGAQHYDAETLTVWRALDPALVVPYLIEAVTEADLRAGTVTLNRYDGHPPWELTPA